MQKGLFPIILALLILLAGCTTTSTNSPSLSDADKIATIVAGTLSAIPSSSSAPTPTTTLTPVVPTPTTSNVQTYVDPDYGFKLQYDMSWNLNTEAGSGLTYYDGRGRRISLNKGDYFFKFTIVDGPADPEGCGGIFDKNPNEQYWKYSINDVEVWRIKAEKGDFFYFIDIVSPLELYTEPIVNEYGENWGNFTCNLLINNYGIRISYIFPDNNSPEIFAEMDNILRSLTWKK